jgi:hypothetical protein
MNALETPMIAQGMIDAVREFSNKHPKHLRDLRFVIFQRSILNEFITVVDDASDSKTQKSNFLGQLWTNVKGTKTH